MKTLLATILALLFSTYPLAAQDWLTQPLSGCSSDQLRELTEVILAVGSDIQAAYDTNTVPGYQRLRVRFNTLHLNAFPVCNFSNSVVSHFERTIRDMQIAALYDSLGNQPMVAYYSDTINDHASIMAVLIEPLFSDVPVTATATIAPTEALVYEGDVSEVFGPVELSSGVYTASISLEAINQYGALQLRIMSVEGRLIANPYVNPHAAGEYDERALITVRDSGRYMIEVNADDLSEWRVELSHVD